MKSKYIIHIILFILVIVSSKINAQLTITNNQTALQLVNILKGLNPGVTITNPTFTAGSTSNQLAKFTGGTSINFPLNEGIVLTTGTVNDAYTGGSGANPNADKAGNYERKTAGDNDLNSLVQNLANDPSVQTYDASVLEFDFTTTSNNIEFKYVFASTEYTGYTCSKFYDVFGFFLTGPKPTGGNYTKENLAIVPGTSTPVCINTINSGAQGTSSDCDETICDQFDPNWKNYKNLFTKNAGVANNPPYNDAPVKIIPNGFTVPLTAKADVICGKTYHIKLVIADANDGILDSYVYLQAGSFGSNDLTQSSQIKDINGNLLTSGNIVEGCSKAILNFTLNTATTSNYDVNYTITGTATNPTDYTATSTTKVTIPAGQKSVTLTIDPKADGIADDGETVIIQLAPTCTTAPAPITITIKDEISLTDTYKKPTCIVGSTSTNADGEIKITAAGGEPAYTYSFDNGATYISSNISSTLTSKNYTIKVKDKNGCIATKTEDLTQICTVTNCTKPSITSDPIAVTKCEGSNTSFTVAATGTSISYQWQEDKGNGVFTDIPGETATTLSKNAITPGMNGYKYRCVVTEAKDGPCSTNSNSATLTVDTKPVSAAGGSKTICSNATATVSGVTASPGTTYSWTENGNGSISAGANTLTPTYTPTTTDVGTPVILTMATVSGNSCPNPGDVTYTINVDALPTSVSVGTTTICSNATATVSGASHTNGNVLWSINGTGNGTITNQTTDSPTYTPIATDAGKTVTLSMHVTSTNSCPDPADVTFKITVDSLPLAKITGSKTICSSNTATITNAKSAYGDIAWTSDGTGTITNGTTLSPTYTPTVNDEGKTVTLTLTVTSNNSCGNTTKATANYLLNVIGAVFPTASTNNGNSTICMEKQVTVSGATSSNGTVSWAITTGSGLLTNETTLTPTYISKANDTISPVKLTMTVNPPVGCGGTPATDIYTINVKSKPTVQPYCNKPCEGNDVQLNANSILNAQYAWTGPKGFSKSTQNVLLAKITASDTGVYNLQITDANNCVNSKSINVSMYSNPVIAGDTFVCVGKTLKLAASTPGNTTSWFSQSTTNLSIDPSTGVASGILGGTSSITFTDVNGCFDNQLILVENLPVVAFTVDSTSVCIGNDVKFSDKSINKNANIIWDFGDGNQSNDLDPSYTYHKVDSFTVTLTSISPNGCIGKLTKEKYITPIDVPTIKFGFTPDSIDIYNPEIQFINYSNANFYTWNFGDYSPISNKKSPNHTFPDTPGQSYKVTLKGSNSSSFVCPISVSHEIVSLDPAIYFIPNTFTPNGDEINNTFQPVFTSGYDPQNFSFWIYNRIGELVFESHNATIGWDGTYAGKMAENNTYVWKLQFKSKQTEKEYYLTGHVNLVK